MENMMNAKIVFKLFHEESLNNSRVKILTSPQQSLTTMTAEKRN